MICTKCTAGGKANQMKETYIAIGLHDQCTGCECQHKVGTGYYKKQAQKKPPTQLRARGLLGNPNSQQSLTILVTRSTS